MRRSGILLVMVTIVLLAGCSDDDTHTSPETKVTTKVAAKTHVLNVTIRDEAPLDAYRAGAKSECTTTRPAELPSQLVISGPDKDSSFDIPGQASLLDDGSCESTITVTVPYAPRYTMGVAMEGHGIAGPEDPGDTEVVTKGKAQDVVVLR